MLKNCFLNKNIFFIVMRGDYGVTFNGDILIKNCKHLGYKTYRGTPTDRRHENGMVLIYSGFPHADERALNWDFGYICYMPRNLYIENLELPFSGVTGVYSPLPDVCFSNALLRLYVKTDRITFKGMRPLTICRSEECTELNSIPATVEQGRARISSYLPLRDKSKNKPAGFVAFAMPNGGIIISKGRFSPAYSVNKRALNGVSIKESGISDDGGIIIAPDCSSSKSNLKETCKI